MPSISETILEPTPKVGVNVAIATGESLAAGIDLAVFVDFATTAPWCVTVGVVAATEEAAGWRLNIRTRMAPPTTTSIAPRIRMAITRTLVVSFVAGWEGSGLGSDAGAAGGGGEAAGSGGSPMNVLSTRQSATGLPQMVQFPASSPRRNSWQFRQ